FVLISAACFFFFQAEDGIRVFHVTVQTCALPISAAQAVAGLENLGGRRPRPGAPPGAMKAAVIGAGWAGLAACAALREAGAQVRSEERRVGKEGRSRGSRQAGKYVPH